MSSYGSGFNGNDVKGNHSIILSCLILVHNACRLPSTILLSLAAFIRVLLNYYPERRDPAPKLTKYRLFKENHSLTSKIPKSVNVLRRIEGQHKELEKQFLEERVGLVEKYHELRKDPYTKRYEVVKGITEVVGVKPDEATEGRASAARDGPDLKDQSESSNLCQVQQLQVIPAGDEARSDRGH
ncbi:hypothetical protein ACLB2K_062798 [Fragaria x ananassa]